jgi:hypothetical protein
MPATSVPPAITWADAPVWLPITIVPPPCACA